MCIKILIIIMVSVTVFCEVMSRDCNEKIGCLENNLLSYIDNLEDSKVVPIVADFVVLERRTENFEKGRSDESFVERCERYLRNHELKIRIPSSELRSLESGARSKRIRKFILPLLVLLKVKAAIIIPIILSAIALVAFKGLGAGLVGLAIAAAVGLKSILESQSPSKISYEIVPQISYSHWSRSGIAPVDAEYHTIP